MPDRTEVARVAGDDFSAPVSCFEYHTREDTIDRIEATSLVVIVKEPRVVVTIRTIGSVSDSLSQWKQRVAFVVQRFESRNDDGGAGVG